MSLASVLRKHLLFDPLGSVVEEKPFSLIKYLDTLNSVETTPPPTANQVYRVSHLIKLCPREEVLRFKYQVPKVQKISAKLRRIFDFGENYHLLMQNKVLANSGYLFGDWVCVRCDTIMKEQVKPKQCRECGRERLEYIELTPKSVEHGISAHVDGVILANGKKKVLELKTVNAISFRLITEIEKRANENHVNQINMYMWLLSIPEGIILYFDKNESQLYQVEVKLNQGYVDRVLQRLASARRGMETGEVPRREVCDSITCARAKTCSVSKVCFQE